MTRVPESAVVRGEGDIPVVHGEAFAVTGIEMKAVVPNMTEVESIEHKQVDMMTKNVVEEDAAIKASEPIEELVAPDEWDALIEAIGNDDELPDESEPMNDADDLWERLSSTRWIKKSVVKSEPRRAEEEEEEAEEAIPA